MHPDSTPPPVENDSLMDELVVNGDALDADRRMREARP